MTIKIIVDKEEAKDINQEVKKNALNAIIAINLDIKAMMVDISKRNIWSAIIVTNLAIKVMSVGAWSN